MYDSRNVTPFFHVSQPSILNLISDVKLLMYSIESMNPRTVNPSASIISMKLYDDIDAGIA